MFCEKFLRRRFFRSRKGATLLIDSKSRLAVNEVLIRLLRCPVVGT
jgi:hypothetical protein